MIRMALVVAGLVVALPSLGEAFCSKPRTPFCLDRSGRFDNRFDYDSCRSELERYGFAIRSYADCQRQLIDDALKEHSSAVAKFEQRTRD
jgi:hypothetical protein